MSNLLTSSYFLLLSGFVLVSTGEACEKDHGFGILMAGECQIQSCLPEYQLVQNKFGLSCFLNQDPFDAKSVQYTPDYDGMSWSTPVLKMHNNLYAKGDGSPNPAFGKRVKNILIFQASGWSGLPQEAVLNSQLVDPEWPLGGPTAYLSKSKDSLMQQIELISQLGTSTSVAVLLMTDADSRASGFGACWNGTWIGGQNCQNGHWAYPRELFREVKYAAWIKGLNVVPYFSITNYEFYDMPAGTRGDLVLPKLKEFLSWVTEMTDDVSLKTDDGRLVVIAGDFPEMTVSQKEEVTKYMSSRQDIYWIGPNMEGVSIAGSNIVMSAETKDRDGSVQNYFKNLWGDHYLWWFAPKWAKTFVESINPNNPYYQPQNIREVQMNINPSDPNRYPVIISQWNEYAEYLIFEPSTRTGQNNYEYLRWMMSMQPD